jgi:Domain of unknown function (DUF1707)
VCAMMRTVEESAVPSPRIGNAEREAAQHALDAHLQAGRLDAEEYGERSGKASVAQTAEDLTPLFADLPEPHPTAGAPAPQPAATPPPVPTTAGTGGSALERIGPGIAAAMPLIALVLFFVVPIANSWIFFLLIPIGGILFAGSRGRRRDGDDPERR